MAVVFFRIVGPLESLEAQVDPGRSLLVLKPSEFGKDLSFSGARITVPLRSSMIDSQPTVEFDEEDDVEVPCQLNSWCVQGMKRDETSHVLVLELLCLVISKELADTKPPSWLARYIIFPGWTSKLVWDLVVMMIVLMDAFVLPFQLSFKRDYGEDTFDDVWFWVTTLCFTADILVTFDTGLTVAGSEQLSLWPQYAPMTCYDIRCAK